jgi:hypothetical protein
VARTPFGPFTVWGPEVVTGVFVQFGDVLEVASTGAIDFSGAVIGRTFNADGDDGRHPATFRHPTAGNTR